jgi:hypothetical protein
MTQPTHPKCTDDIIATGTLPLCSNCGQSIQLDSTGTVWHHANRHTVCDWRQEMEPTDRVATPVIR